MPRPGIASSRASAAEAYGVLRCLSLQQGIVGKPLAAAQEALSNHGLTEIESPCRDHDQRLLQECVQADDVGAFLCLRCRVSWPLEQRVRSLHRQNARNYGVELIALAAIALDDTGRVLPFQPRQERPGRRVPAEPFGVAVIRSYRPERSGLGRWAQQKLMGHGPLRDYLRQHGVRLLRDWALLADASNRQVVEAVSRLDGSVLPDKAGALHRRYVPLYRQAKLLHLQQTGRQQGWEPDQAFLQAVEPDQPPGQTKELLERIAKAVRRLESGRWLKQENALFDGDGPDRLGSSTESPRDANEAGGLGDLETVNLVEEVGLEYATALVKTLQPESLELRIWKAWAWGGGLPQRQIAERCSTREAPVSQSRVSRVVNEKIRAGEIATLALERLRQSQPERATAQWAELFRSVEQLLEVEGRLMNHLLKPEQEGGISHLRRWVQRTLQSSIAPGAEDQCSGEWR